MREARLALDVQFPPSVKLERVGETGTEVEDGLGTAVTIEKLYLMTGRLDGLDYFGQQEANLAALGRGLGTEVADGQ